MSFLDYVLASFGVFEVKGQQEKRPSKKLLPKTLTMPTKENKTTQAFSQSSSQMAFFCPTTEKEIVETAKFLSSNQPAMVDFSALPKTSMQRSIDFLSGAKTALGFKLKILENNLFVFVPKNFELVEFLGEEK